MAEKLLMPKLSPTMEEGQIARWLKKEGEQFKNGENIAEIDTDKATMEMSSLKDATLLKIIKGEGETVALGDPIAIIGKAGEDFSALLGEISSNGKAESNGNAQQSNDAKQETPANDSSQKAETSLPKLEDVDVSETAGRSYDYQEAETPKSDNQAPKNADNESGRLIISPIAARMAAEAGINLKTLQGSGPGGRIIKRDIETAVEKSKVQSPTPKVEHQEVVQTQEVETPRTVASQDKPIASNVPTFDVSPPFRDEPTTQMRRTIATRLTSSIGPVPHFFLTVEIEMDEAAKLRKQINGALPEEKKVSLNDVIIKVVANALIQHPQVNASFQDKNLRFYERADIGVAVAVPDGLITPVIRGANYKGIAQIASEVKELAGRAKSRKLKPEEYTGATFSISNLGMFGIEEFTAVINPPEAAILAIGTAENKAVVRDNEIVIRNIMRVTLSCDHRVIDGVTGSKFLQSVKQMLENPILLLM